MSARVHVDLTDRPLSSDEAQAWLAHPAAGAIVLFTGTVRDHSEGRDVAGLEYEAYTERALPQLHELGAEVAEKWPSARAIWLTHRVGTLAIGEPSVVVGVSADHRAEAFEAARHGIDTLKATVAIWKKEHWAAGDAHWPGAPR